VNSLRLQIHIVLPKPPRTSSIYLKFISLMSRYFLDGCAVLKITFFNNLHFSHKTKAVLTLMLGGKMKNHKIYLLGVVTLLFFTKPLYANVNELYTQSGSDVTWQHILNNNLIPIGKNSGNGVSGSKINVNNALVEVGPYANFPLDRENTRIHTVGNAVIGPNSFSRWSRWYQEDGNTQVFRLFKNEENVRNSRAAAARIEAFSTVKWKKGKWHEWVGTYTFIKPINTNIFQAKNNKNDWSVHLNMTNEGHLLLNHRRGQDKIIARNMVGKPFHIRVRDNGLKYEVYLNGEFQGSGEWARPEGDTNFRWGMYMGKSIPDRDAMIFVTGATVDPKNTPVYTPTPTPTPAPTSTPAPVSTPAGPSENTSSYSCMHSAQSLEEAKSLFSEQCGNFSRKDCDPVEANGQTSWVCASYSFSSSSVSTLSGNTLRIEAEDFSRAKDSDAQNRNGDYRDSPVDVIEFSEGNYKVGHISSGEQLVYDFLVETPGEYELHARISSPYDTGMLSVSMNDHAGSRGNMSIPNTRNWSTFATEKVIDLGSLSAGVNTLTLDIESGRFDIDWIEIRSQQNSTKTATAASATLTTTPTTTPTTEPTITPTTEPKPEQLPTSPPLPEPVPDQLPGPQMDCYQYDGSRMEIDLSQSSCINFPSGLASFGGVLQVWDSDLNTGCNFRGKISASDSGELSVGSNYTASITMQGSSISVSPNNGCNYLKIRYFDFF